MRIWQRQCLEGRLLSDSQSRAGDLERPSDCIVSITAGADHPPISSQATYASHVSQIVQNCLQFGKDYTPSGVSILDSPRPQVI
jgi:hypothetical protein